MKKIVLCAGLFLFVASCQFKTTKTITPTSNTPSTVENNNVESTKVDAVAVDQIVLPQVKSNGKAAQFGFIFSGGGVRTWAYVNILKEVQKYKLPVAAVAGMEWGAIVAGVYAQNVSANEVEWELSKFKNIDGWSDYVKNIFEKKSTGALKIPFGCMSLNLKNQTSYVLNKGQLDSLVPFCVPAPGVSKPYADSIASMSDVVGAVQFLRANGATKVILINANSARNGKPLSSGLQSVENQFWIQSNSVLVKKNVGIDEVIDVDINGGISADKFDQRRDVLNSSLPQAKDQLKKIAQKYGY
jgi:predicted acylesterase/phospholipase RssA